MRRTWCLIPVLLQILFTFLISAATLPPSLQLSSGANLISNGSLDYVTCRSKSNVTYPIYDSPLELAMTFGHRPILSWQLTTYLQYILIAIKGNADRHPNDYLPRGYYHYHEPGHLGAVSVVPSLFRNFTWANLYLVLHALAEYIVTAPHAYEMCVEINFRAGGFAGVIFLTWWTSDVPHVPRLGNRRLLELDS